MLSSIFSTGKGDRLERKGGLFLPTEGQTEPPFLLVKFEKPVCFLKWSSLLSRYTGGSSLLVEDEVETYTLILKDGGALSIFTRSELSSIFLRLR